MEIALQMMKSKGSIHLSDLPALCIPYISADQLGKASNALLKDYLRLFDVNSSVKHKITVDKKSDCRKETGCIRDGMSAFV